MPEYLESDLTFVFPDDWRVRQFDATVAYRSVSGRGIKGVDFVAISPDGALWLVEVKNYRPRYKGDREYLARRKDPAALAAAVSAKFRDSIRLIHVIRAHIHGSALRRLQLWYRVHLRPSRGSNYLFWHDAHRLAARGRAVEYVLWMETPEANDDYDHRVYTELRRQLPDRNIIVAEQDAPRGLPFGVR